MTEQTLSERVAANVRAELARANISQAKLAEKLNTTQQTISRRMTGQVPFTIEELDTIAGIVGIPLTTFLGGVAA